GKEGLAGADDRSLIIGEEESAVLAAVTWNPHGPAHGGSKLVHAKRRFFRSEKIPGVERAVAQEVKETSMQFVGAGLDVYIHHGPSRAPELGAHGIGLDAKLRNGVGRRSVNETGLVGQILGKTVVVDAVEQIVILEWADAVGAEAAGSLIAGARCGGGSARGQHRQPGEEAAIQTQ